jgi:CheY-like chemotaxis protein
VALTVSLRPDLVLMDVRMPGVDGLEATRRIGTAAPETVVVLLTADESDVPGDHGAAAIAPKRALRRAQLRLLWDRHRCAPAPSGPAPGPAR